MSVCDEADRAGDQQRHGADDRADVLGGGRELEQRVHARDQVDAGGDHRRGVDQRADRRRALHRVREPGVQRDLGGLRERADEQQQAAGDEVRRRSVPWPNAPASAAWKRLQEVERAGVLEDEVRAEHEADVADDVDHERLDPRLGGGRAPVPEGDQQVGGGADERPADDQQQEVAREHQQQHREDEEVQVGEVAREAAVARPGRRPSRGGSASRRR